MSTRISTSQVYDGARGNILEAHSKLATTTDKASTNKEITKPSQAPSDWLRASNLKDEATVRDSVIKNAHLVSHMLSATENALTQIQDAVQRAQELAVQQSSTGITSAATRDAVLSEVRGLYQAAIQAANSRYADRTLLAGFRTQGNAFDQAGNYLGDGGVLEVEVDKGLKVAISTSGEQAILGKGLPNGVDILDTLRRLGDGLATNNTEMIRGTLDDLVNGNQQLSLMRSDIGGRMNQIDQAINTGETNRIQNLDGISKLEDADAIKVFSDLTRDQTVLRAAVSTSNKILSENPADILFK